MNAWSSSVRSASRDENETSRFFLSQSMAVFFTIAKNTAIDWLKKKRDVSFSSLEADRTEEDQAFIDRIHDSQPSPAELTARGMEQRRLSLAMAQLPVAYNSVLNLRHYSELTFREIGIRLKQPLNTVKSRYRRGLALLKKLL